MFSVINAKRVIKMRLGSFSAHPVYIINTCLACFVIVVDTIDAHNAAATGETTQDDNQDEYDFTAGMFAHSNYFFLI